MNESCKRCGGTAVEYLEFKSQHKQTKVYLCLTCFEACRKVFEIFMKTKPEVRSDRLGS